MKHYEFKDAAVVLAGASAAREFLEPIFYQRNQELTIAAFCDHRLRVVELLSFPGDEASSVISFPELIRHSHGCEGVLLAHNHPGGDPEPSQADLQTTRRLSRLLEGVDVSFLDHLIFAGGEMTSLRQRGWL